MNRGVAALLLLIGLMFASGQAHTDNSTGIYKDNSTVPGIASNQTGYELATENPNQNMTQPQSPKSNETSPGPMMGPPPPHAAGIMGPIPAQGGGVMMGPPPHQGGSIVAGK